MRDNVIPFPRQSRRHALIQEISSILASADSYQSRPSVVDETVVERLERAVERLEKLAQKEA